MAAGEALIAARDQVGTGFITGSAAESVPPWNEAAATAVMSPHAGLRVLEAEVRAELGLPPVERGGSDGNTAETIESLVRMARALPRESAMRVARKMDRWVNLALALPAFNNLPYWMVIRLPGAQPPDCPYCGTPSLRISEAYGIVACLHPACPLLARGRLWAYVRVEGGQLRWRWPDGTVQP
jgi:hypothetical protein